MYSNVNTHKKHFYVVYEMRFMSKTYGLNLLIAH